MIYLTTLQREISLEQKIAEGGQWEIYSTNHEEYMVKVFKPAFPPTDFSATATDAALRYRLFSALGLHWEKELPCLPCEALDGIVHPEVGTTAAYLMKRARGAQFELNPAFCNTSILNRLLIAKSLAHAITYLHGLGIVHADFKPQNFWLEVDSAGNALMQVLDIDGGGFYGVARGYGLVDIPPNVLPQTKYRSPELTKAKRWDDLWQQAPLRRQPDLWALAVMIYQILVDSEGPFPCRREQDDQEGKYYRNGDASLLLSEWPKPIQEATIEATQLTTVFELFKSVFKGEKRANHENPARPTASDWRTALDQEIRRRTWDVRLEQKDGGIVGC